MHCSKAKLYNVIFLIFDSFYEKQAHSMKISYNWLKEYLPADPIASTITENPQKLAAVLTSVGLEVEDVYKSAELTSDLQGLLTGEIISSEKHPGADKLKVTTVSNGHGNTLQIVCGAPNVAA